MIHHFNIGNFAHFGYVAVEFFFFISGFMLIAQFDEDVNPAAHFIKKMLPILLSTQIIFVVFELIWFNHDPVESFNIAFYSILDALGLSMTGLPAYRLNGSIWYISAYFISIMILYSTMRLIGRRTMASIAPAIGVLSIGFLYWAYSGTVSVWWVYEYKYCLLLRAIGDMCLGITIYMIVQWVQKFDFTVLGKTLNTVLEVSMIASSIFLMISGIPEGVSEFIITSALFVGVTLVLSEKTYIPCRLKTNNDGLSKQFAYLSMLIYLSHDYWAYSISDIVPGISDAGVVAAVCVLTAITMIIGGMMARTLTRFTECLVMPEHSDA